MATSPISVRLSDEVLSRIAKVSEAPLSTFIKAAIEERIDLLERARLANAFQTLTGVEPDTDYWMAAQNEAMKSID